MTRKPRRAVMVPSFFTPLSISMTMPSRRLSGARNSSRRENTSLHRAPGLAGEHGDVRLVVEAALAAEAAAQDAAR